MLKGSTLQVIVISEYIELDAQIKGLTQRSIKNRRNSLGRFFRFSGDIELTLDVYLAYVSDMKGRGLSLNSIRQELRVLKALVRWFYRKGYLDEDLSLEIPLIKVPRKMVDVLPLEVIEKVIGAGTKAGKGDNSINKGLKIEARDALTLILYTGIRVSELLRLKGKDINLADKTFVVRGKSGNDELLPLAEPLLPMLKKRLGNDRLFFVTSSHLNTCLKRGCDRLDIKLSIRCHGLRHSFSTSMLQRNASLQFVSRLLRHSSVKMTDQVYSHLLVDDMRRVLNSYHPLALKSLEPKQVFDMVKEAIEVTKVQEDKRFNTEVKRDKEKIVLIIRYKRA